MSYDVVTMVPAGAHVAIAFGPALPFNSILAFAFVAEVLHEEAQAHPCLKLHSVHRSHGGTFIG